MCGMVRRSLGHLIGPFTFAYFTSFHEYRGVSRSFPEAMSAIPTPTELRNSCFTPRACARGDATHRHPQAIFSIARETRRFKDARSPLYGTTTVLYFIGDPPDLRWHCRGMSIVPFSFKRRLTPRCQSVLAFAGLSWAWCHSRVRSVHSHVG